MRATPPSMFPKSVSRPVPRRRSGADSSPSFRRGKIGFVDVVMVIAGLALLAGVGLVAYRTQVRGESIDTVFPFLAQKPVVAATPASPTPARASVAAYTPPPIAAIKTTTPVTSTKPVGTTDASLAPKDPGKIPTADRATSGDTLFGRHYEPTKPTKPAAPMVEDDEYEYGEQTVFGRVRRKKVPGTTTKPTTTPAKEPAKDPAKK